MIAGIVAAYLVGSVPFGLLVGRLKGIDIRTQGSGNIGATNVGRVLGRPYGYGVFVLDVLKGLLPALAASRLWVAWGGDPGAVRAAEVFSVVAVAGAAILGHVFPIYLWFKGGKGVATSLGALLGVYPFFTLPGAVALLVWIVLTLSTRYVSVGSVGAAAAFPALFAATAWYRAGQWPAAAALWPLYVFAVAMAALVIYRHRSNLKRLWQGTESRIGRRAVSPPPPANPLDQDHSIRSSCS